jgi:hypothetical protein
MNRGAPIVLMMVVAVLGFISGASLELVLDGPDSKISRVTNFIAGVGTGYEFIPVIKTAQMSGSLQTIIETANIGFAVAPVLIDPTGSEPGSGDEYFDNEINVCRFHSDEDINGSVFLEESFDDGICIVCKLLHDEEPCEDIWLDFTNLPDETTETDINNALAADGITVSAQAFNANDPNTVMIFDADIAHGTVDEDIESMTNAGGDCLACDNQHMVIIPEGIAGVAKIPLDDSASGGIQTWKFNPPRFVTSFDFFDKDNGQLAEARAYLNSDCTGLITTVPIPNGHANDVDTIIMNANNVACLEIEYPDSGGVSNFDLRCVEHANVLEKGKIDLPLGYQASDTIEIPIPNGVDVLEVSGVKILIQTVILDFEGLPAGTILNTQYEADFGITIDGEDHNGNHLDPQVFDTDASGTPDPDLEVDIGNVAIVPEDFNAPFGVGDVPADDSASGGKQIFHFDPPRYVNSLIFLDADRGGTIGFVTAYDEFDNVIGAPVPIPTAGESSIQVLVMMNTEKTTRLEVQYEDSGAIKGLNLGCPLPTDPLDMGPINDPQTDELFVELIVNDVWDLDGFRDVPLRDHIIANPQVEWLNLVSDESIDSNWSPSPNTNVIVISESVDSSKVSELKSIGVGIVTVEGYTWDELDLGTSGDGVNGAGVDVKILDNSHYITQALGVNNGDTVTIADVAGNSGRILGWDAGSSQIDALATYTSPSDDSEARLLAVESGDTLADGSSAADRRVFLGARFFDNLNSIGDDLFDRALLWAAGLA